MCSRSFAIALALVAMSGCKLAESEPALRLVAVRSVSNVAPIVRVETSGVDRAHLFVDGLELPGTVPVGQDVPVKLPKVGANRVQARVYRGTSAQDSAPLELTWDMTPPSVTFSPPEGSVYSTAPFVVTATFDKPLDPTTVTGETVTLYSSAQGAVPIVVTLSPDGRRIEIRAATDLATLDDVYLRLAVRDLAGNPVPEHLPWSWWAPVVRRCFWDSRDTLPAFVSGTAQIPVSWVGGPEPMTVLANGTPIGTARRDGVLAWDTTTVPDGSYALTLSAPGWFVQCPPFTLSVRNAPPALLGCTVSASAPSSFLVEARFDQPVWYVGGGNTSACVPVAPDRIACKPAQEMTLPGPWTLDVTGIVKNLAFVAAQQETCTVELPAWRAPFGDGAIRSSAGMLGPEIVSAYTAPAGDASPDFLQVVRRSLAGGPAAGRIELLSAQGPQALAPAYTYVSSGATAAREGRPAATDGWLIWLEPAAGGDVVVRTNVGTSVTRPASSDVRLPRALDGFARAWTELESGRRVVRRLEVAPWWTVTPPANVTVDGSVAEAAASGWSVAFVETGADGLGRLYVRVYSVIDVAWTSLGDVLNADPTMSASEPAVGGDYGSLSDVPCVAWVEGGRVLARSWDPASGVWSAPVSLSDGRTGVTVRSPVIVGSSYDPNPKVVFVERENGVDRFVVYRWGPSNSSSPGFHALAPLETGGVVTGFTVSPDPLTVSWTDDAGAVRVRVAMQ